MKRMAWLVLLLFAVMTLGHADQVYKWVDAQGNVHYSDKPHPGAKKVKIVSPQSYSAAEADSVSKINDLPAGSRTATDKSPRQYAIAITAPKPQASLWNVQSVTVSVQVTPGLGPGDAVTYVLDGQSHGPVEATSFTFDDVDRGEHHASAVLNTARGQVITASPVTFYIHQTTVFHGKPPQ